MSAQARPLPTVPTRGTPPYPADHHQHYPSHWPCDQGGHWTLATTHPPLHHWPTPRAQRSAAATTTDNGQCLSAHWPTRASHWPSCLLEICSTFARHLLDICSTFARHLLDMCSTRGWMAGLSLAGRFDSGWPKSGRVALAGRLKSGCLAVWLASGSLACWLAGLREAGWLA